MNEYDQHFYGTPKEPGIGVNAKTIRRRVSLRRLSTTGQARVLAGFAAGMEKRVAAISQLHPQLDKKAIERIQKIDSDVLGFARSYISTGKLPDWSKSLNKDIKQFFRLRHLLSQPDSHTISIRLGHKVAEAALSAPRGPADYLAGVIMRTLKALGISTELVFNLEFVHGICRENHPLHIHGALCAPDDQIDIVTEALTRVLASDYRARWTNVAVLLEEPHPGGFWASYCIKESAVTSEMLSRRGVRNKLASYASRRQSQRARAFYNRIEDWLSIK
ncbi:hypothetical protein [Pseudomonas fluorescens]|uniref:hypothetical protein n=1 Tax=Pseudomonas fluorescens TaxID=294 RepID=UPI0012495C0C|nr:hypothetical protein [Pseudomonas fluorescens]CAG8870230.1 hypothetical protein PS861_03365 [Pseudomonas fluorescens]